MGSCRQSTSSVTTIAPNKAQSVSGVFQESFNPARAPNTAVAEHAAAITASMLVANSPPTTLVLNSAASPKSKPLA
jgi:hypothetical protein